MTPISDDDSLAFLSGCAMPGGGVCVIAAAWGTHDNEERATQLVLLGRGQPVKFDVNANVLDVVAIMDGPTEKLIALARGDLTFTIDVTNGRVDRHSLHPDRPVWLNGAGGVHAAGDVILAYGSFGQVYACRRGGAWEPYDDGIYDCTPSVKSPLITAIVGEHPDALYAVGSGGLLAYRGDLWRRLDCPTNVNLNHAVMTPDGGVVACGDAGVVIRGRGDRWEAAVSGIPDGLWGVALFRDTLYVSTLEGLWCLDDDLQAKPVDTGLAPLPTSYRVFSTTDALWSVGLCDVLRFDGASWRRIISSDEGVD